MKSLLLSGYNIHLSIDDEKLVVMDGKGWNKDPTEMIFKLKLMNYDNIIIYGHSGNITLSAIYWLMRHKVSVNIIDYDGSFLTSMNPPQLKFSHVGMAQYKAYQNNRIEIGKKFIEAKIKGTETVMKWLDERYSEIQPHIKKMDFSKILEDLNRAITGKDVLSIEGNLSRKYWTALREIFPENFHFKTRDYKITNVPKGPIDPINSLFNHGYAVLEGICLRAINGANLDPYIGFFNRMKLTRSPLVDDFQEPYQWLVDKTIIQALEHDFFNNNDFLRTEDSIIQMRPNGVKKLIEELDKTFSQPIKYKGRNHQWYVLIQIKAQELSNYLINNRKNIDFSTPEPYLEKRDSRELREKILNIIYSDWIKMGYSPGSLHYLKKCAKSDKPFKLNKPSAQKLDTMNKEQ